MPEHHHETRLRRLVQDMVNIYSPSGKEQEITEYLFCLLQRQLEPYGCRISLQPVDESRSNILVETPGQPSASPHPALDRMLFLGHIDTVPAYDIENYQLSPQGDLLYGLGTSDMKSGCAAMIEAFCRSSAAGDLPENTMLALVVGEEETGDGTLALLNEYRFHSALVAEPTGLIPCSRHYGYVEMLARAFGYRRHAAMSGRDTNAIRAMLRFLLQIEDRVELHEPDTVLNIRDLYSSESGFAVPDRCTASVDLHLPPGIDTVAYAERLREFGSTVLEDSRCTAYELEFPTLADGYCLAEDAQLLSQLRQVFTDSGLKWQPGAFTSHSDANLLHAAGCSPVILGPGELAKAHTRDEAVSYTQITAAADLYTRLLQH